MAIPGILQQIAKSNPMTAKIKQMMSMVNGSQNPQMMLNQLMTANPNLKQVMDFIQESGGDPKTAFYSMADKMGVDPQEILNMLKN